MELNEKNNNIDIKYLSRLLKKEGRECPYILYKINYKFHYSFSKRNVEKLNFKCNEKKSLIFDSDFKIYQYLCKDKSVPDEEKYLFIMNEISNYYSNVGGGYSSIEDFFKEKKINFDCIENNIFHTFKFLSKFLTKLALVRIDVYDVYTIFMKRIVNKLLDQCIKDYNLMVSSINKKGGSKIKTYSNIAFNTNIHTAKDGLKVWDIRLPGISFLFELNQFISCFNYKKEMNFLELINIDTIQDLMKGGYLDVSQLDLMYLLLLKACSKKNFGFLKNFNFEGISLHNVDKPFDKDMVYFYILLLGKEIDNQYQASTSFFIYLVDYFKQFLTKGD